jgi:hypothetical protein
MIWSRAHVDTLKDWIRPVTAIFFRCASIQPYFYIRVHDTTSMNLYLALQQGYQSISKGYV